MARLHCNSLHADKPLDCNRTGGKNLFDNPVFLYYDNFINTLSVKGAHRTFRQFLPDIFTHWQGLPSGHVCPLPTISEREDIT